MVVRLGGGAGGERTERSAEHGGVPGGVCSGRGGRLGTGEEGGADGATPTCVCEREWVGVGEGLCRLGHTTGAHTHHMRHRRLGSDPNPIPGPNPNPTHAAARGRKVPRARVADEDGAVVLQPLACPFGEGQVRGRIVWL